MVNVDTAVIARLTSHGQNFELLVDCNNALAVKQGKTVDNHDLLGWRLDFRLYAKPMESCVMFHTLALSQMIRLEGPIATSIEIPAHHTDPHQISRLSGILVCRVLGIFALR